VIQAGVEPAVPVLDRYRDSTSSVFLCRIVIKNKFQEMLPVSAKFSWKEIFTVQKQTSPV